MTPYVALLRGINVGGKNPIRMSDLTACFETNGFRDVATYIQSGNVVFTSDERRSGELTARIERMLSEAFPYEASIVLRTHRQLRAIVDGAPAGFGDDPGRYRYDVIFLKAPLTASTAMRSVTTRDGVDEAAPGAGVLYFSRLIALASQSRLSRVVSTPVYRDMTIRNWKTTTKLLAMLDTLGGRGSDRSTTA
jgi:uncharacterized protein (DUF1697 family)